MDRNEHFRGFGPSCEMDVSVQVPLQGSYWTSALDLRPLETFGHPPLVPLKKKGATFHRRLSESLCEDTRQVRAR